MTQCPHCAFSFSGSPDSCPSCGERLKGSSGPRHPEFETSLKPVARYFGDLRKILLEPAKFFKTVPVTGGLAQPLAFALITHWLGSSLAFLWRSLVGMSMRSWMDRWTSQFMDLASRNSAIDQFSRNSQFFQAGNKMMTWFWGAGSVIMDPFTTLVSILFTSFIVFIGARLFVAHDSRSDARVPDPTYESAVRIVAYGLTPAILAAIPFMGGLAAGIYTLVVTVVAAREIYRISNARATVVALFPKIILLGFVLVGLGVMLLFVKLVFAAGSA